MPRPLSFLECEVSTKSSPRIWGFFCVSWLIASSLNLTSSPFSAIFLLFSAATVSAPGLSDDSHYRSPYLIPPSLDELNMFVQRFGWLEGRMELWVVNISRNSSRSGNLFLVLALKYGKNTVSLSLTHFFPSGWARGCKMEEGCIFFINANSLCMNTVDQKPLWCCSDIAFIPKLIMLDICYSLLLLLLLPNTDTEWWACFSSLLNVSAVSCCFIVSNLLSPLASCQGHLQI